jgi:hypothetical protein
MVNGRVRGRAFLAGIRDDCCCSTAEILLHSAGGDENMRNGKVKNQLGGPKWHLVEYRPF